MNNEITCTIIKRGKRYKVTDQTITNRLLNLKFKIDYHDVRKRFFFSMLWLAMLALSTWSIMCFAGNEFCFDYKYVAFFFFSVAAVLSLLCSWKHAKQAEESKREFLSIRDSIPQNKLEESELNR